MWLDNINTSGNSYKLTNEEVIIVKKYIKENRIIMETNFKSTLEKLKKHYIIKEESGRPVEVLLAIKALIIMKENWAENIDELDTLNSNIKKVVSTENIEEQNTKINKLKEEREKQQEENLDKAVALAENIKNWNSYKLTNEEAIIVKKYIEENRIIMETNFKSTLEKLKKHYIIKKESGRPVEVLLAIKALIMMKEIWAENIDEFDKIYN